jgi:thymidylate kinase
MTCQKADAQSMATRPFLITFSGIDGAGKTTQIEHLGSVLQEQGLRVLRLSFWEHVAVWSSMRAGVSHWAVDSCHTDRAAGRSFSPKNNKHVRNLYLTVARAGFYMLDVVRLQRLLASPQVRNSDVVIFDRYIYDQLVNVYSQSLTARTYSKVLLQRTPAPDLAFVLDAAPAAAFARKPEYPLEFMVQNRQNFLRIRELVPQLIIIPDAGEEDVRSEIRTHISHSRLAEGTSTEGTTEVAMTNAVVRRLSSCRVRNDSTAGV